MGVCGQLGLLLKKNLKLRIRSPVLTLTLLLVPVVLFVGFAIIRLKFPPNQKPSCYYDAKAMPSRGMVPFMQSLACDLDTSCRGRGNVTRNGNDLPPYARSSLAQISNSLEPILKNRTTVESLKKLPDTIQPLAELGDLIDFEAVANFTEKKYRVADFFHDASDVQRYLVEEGELDATVVDALLNAQMDVYQLLEVTGFIDFKGTACNATKLSQILTFPADVDVSAVSKALCDVKDQQISIIVEELQKQLDVPYLITEFSEFLKALRETDWSELLDNTKVFLEQLENLSNLGQLPDLLGIVRLVPVVQELISKLALGNLENQLDVASNLIESLDAQLNNATWWMDVKKIALTSQGLLRSVSNFLENTDVSSPITLGSLLHNDTIIMDVFQQFNITQEDVQALLQLQLKQDKMVEFLQLLTMPDDIADLLCSSESPSLSDFVNTSSESISSNIQSLQETICGLGNKTDKFFQMLLNQTNIFLLIDQVNQGFNAPVSQINWRVILEDVRTIIESTQNLPAFVKGLPELLAGLSDVQLMLPSMDFNQILGLSQGSTSPEDLMQLLSSDQIISMVQDMLSQTPLWPQVEYQLILNHLISDIQLAILDVFKDVTCRNGWHSKDLSCYKYIYEVLPDRWDAHSRCKEIHPSGHLVGVNNWEEQQYLESIGENTLTWLGLWYLQPYLFIDGFNDSDVDSEYQNWISSQNSSELCGKANFGTDGLWHHVDCTTPTDSLLCEIPQDNKVIQLLRDEPTIEITKVLLELGPNVTEAIIHSFLNATRLEALFNMSSEEQAMVLCSVDLVTLPPSADLAEVRQKLCSLNLTMIFADEIQHWEIPGLDSKIQKFLHFLQVNPALIPPEYLHYANLSAIIQKNNLISEVTVDVLNQTFDIQFLMSGFDDIIGSQSEWLDMLQRVSMYLSGMTMLDMVDASAVHYLETLDMQLGEVPWWTMVKKIISSGQQIISSMFTQLATYQGDDFTLGSLFRNDSIIRDILQSQLNLSAQDIQSLLQLNINMDKLPVFVQMVSSSQDPLSLLCLGQLNLTDVLVFPVVNTTSRMIQLVWSLQTQLCQLAGNAMNNTDLIAVITRELDLTILVDQITDTITNSTGNINWGTLIQEISLISGDVQSLPRLLQTLMPGLLSPFQLQLPGVSGNSSHLGGTLGMLLDMSPLQIFQYIGTQVLPTLVEEFLNQTDFWPAVQEQLVYQNLALDVQLSILGLFSDPILFQRLTEEPFFQTTKAVLELGPNVTEAVLQAFLNATKVEMLLMSTNPSEQLTVLCRDDFVILPPGSEDARQQLCSFNLTALWTGLAPHSNLVYLVAKINELQAFVNRNSMAIPAEFAHYANLTDIIQKSQLMSKLYAFITQRSFHPEILLESFENVTGSEAEWLSMFNRISGMMTADFLSQSGGSLLPLFALENPTLQFSIASIPFANTLIQSTNQLFVVAQEFAEGRIFSGAMPETERFLRGIMGLLEQGPMLLSAVTETLTDPAKSTNLFMMSNMRQAFCNATVRDWLPMNSSTLMDSLDNYLCAVNYPLLAEELKDLISLDDFMLELQTLTSNSTVNINSTYIADVTRNVELLMQNVNTLPTILGSFSQHYNLGSLVTVVEALLTATAMQYGNIIPQNDINSLDLEVLLQDIPGLQMILNQVTDGNNLAELKTVHASINFLNRLFDQAKANPCREGWYRHKHSCYTYMNESGLLWIAHTGCLATHSRSHVVDINTQEEQAFLQGIGHDKDSWINLYHDSQGFYWINSWQTPDYQNIAPGGPGQWGNLSCGKANFGGDGLWYPANCSVPLPSYICEAAPELNITLSTLFRNPSSLTDTTLQALEQVLNQDMLSQILAAPFNLEELVRVILANNLNSSLCDNDQLRALFAFPDSVNVTQLHEALCSNGVVGSLEYLAATEVFKQIMDEVTAFQQDTFNISSFVTDIENLFKHLTSLGNYNVNTNINPEPFLPILQMDWNQVISESAILQRLESFAVMFNNESWYSEINTTMRAAYYLSQVFTEKILLLKGQHIVLPELGNLLVNASETRHLLDLANFSPQLIDVMLSLAVNQDKLQELLNLPSPLVTMCNAGNFSSYFNLPIDSTTDLLAVEGALCSLNLTLIDLEFKELFPIDAIIYKILDTSSRESTNFTVLFNQYKDLWGAADTFLSDPLSVSIDEAWFLVKYQEILEVLQVSANAQGNLLSPTQQDTALQTLWSLSKVFKDEPWWPEIEVGVNAATLIIQYTNKKLDFYSGKNLTIFDLVPPVTADLLQEAIGIYPDILGYLLHSSVNVQTLVNLTGSDNLFNLLCLAEPTEFMTFPPSVNTTAVQAVLCSLNETLLVLEWNQELLFFLDWRFARLNWTALMDSATSLIQTLNNLQASPPHLDLIYTEEWALEKLNQTLDILGTLAPVTSTMSVADFESLLMFLDSILMETGDATYQAIIAQLRMEDYIRTVLLHQMDMFIGQNITVPTLKELFADVDSVTSLLALWDFTPEMIEAVLSLSTQQPDWSVFWTTPDPFEYFCSTNQFEAFFKLPAGSQSNLTAVQEAVCSLNFNLIQLELSQFYNVSQIQLEIDGIIRHDPSLEPFNWTVWIVNNMRWSDAVNRLVSMPTGFVVDTAWWNKTEVRVHDILMNWLEMQSMTSTGNSTVGYLQAIEANLRSSGVWNIVKPYIDIFTIALEGNPGSTGTMLTNLFNFTSVDSLVTSLSVSPELLKVSLASSAFSIYELALFENQGVWNDVFCNSTVFNFRYPLPPTVNSTAVQQAMCALNRTEFFNQAFETYRIDILKLQPLLTQILSPTGQPAGSVDWEHIVKLTEELSTFLMEMQTIPNFLYTQNMQGMQTSIVDLLNAVQERNLMVMISVLEEIRPYFQDSRLITDIQDSLQQSLDQLDWFSASNPLGSLQLVEEQLKIAGVWHYVTPFLEMANVILDGVNNDLNPGGEALPAFLYNRTVLDRFLQSALDRVSPELAQTIILEEFYSIATLAYRHLTNTWEETFCTPFRGNSYYGYPPEINGTALRQMLCQLNRTEFFGMLDFITGVDVLRVEQLIFEMYNYIPRPPLNETYQQQFDWEALIANVDSVIVAVQGMMGTPSFNENGNMTQMLILLQELQAGLSQFNLKLTVEILEQLDPLMNQGGVWLDVKHYVATVTDIAEIINQQLELLAETGYTIENLFSDAAPAYLTQFLSPENVQALLNASINPGMIGILAQPVELSSVLCDAAQFDAFILLPEGSDKAAIQSALCGLSMANETLYDLMATFNFNKLQLEIQKLLMSNFPPGTPVEVGWQQTLDEFQLVVNNFLTIPTGHDFLGVFLSQWLALSLPTGLLPLMQSNLTSDLISYCDQSLPPELINTEAWQTMIKPALDKVDLVMQITDDLVFALPGHQEELQSLLNNMTLIVDLLTVFTEVRDGIMAAGTSILFDPFKLSMASRLIFDIVRGDIPEGIVCNEVLLKESEAVPAYINLTDVSNLLCGIQKLVHTQAVQDTLRIVAFDDIMLKITALFEVYPVSSEPFSCPAFIMNTQEYIERLASVQWDYELFIQSFQLPEYFDLLAVLPQILSNISTTELQSLNELFNLLTPLAGPLLSSDTFSNGTIMDSLLPYLEQMDEYLGAQQGNLELLDLNTLWLNTSSIKQYLSEIPGLSFSVIDALINAKLNTSALVVLTTMPGNLAEHLCMNDAFSTVLIMDDSNAASEIQRVICEALNSQDTLDYLLGSLNATEIVRLVTMSTPLHVVITWPEYLNELLTALEDFSALDPTTIESILTDQWPLLEDGITNSTEIAMLAMNAKDWIQLMQSFQPVLDVLQPALIDDPWIQSLQALLDSLNGFDNILDLITKLPDLSLEKFFRNSTDFREFLMSDIGFSHQAASDLLSATVKFEEVAAANFSQVNSIICTEEQLTKIIEFPEGANVSYVIESLCTLDSEQLVNVLDGVLQRLNIGTLIQEVITNSLVKILGNTTSSMSNISKAAGDLKVVQEYLPGIMAQIQAQEIDPIDILAITNSFFGETSAQHASSQSLTDLVCGKGNKVSSLPSRRRRSIDGRRTKREEEFEKVEGSTPFCSSLFKSIQSSESGRIIWAFVKPMLLGKIPYAPSNNATAKIIKEANFFFDDITDIRDLAAAWLAGSKDLDKLLGSEQTSTIQKFLDNSYTSGYLMQQLNLDTDAITTLLASELTSIPKDDRHQMDQVAELFVNITDCIELDRFIPFQSEREMEREAQRLHNDGRLFAGVFFSNMKDAETLPPHVQYKIRMDVDNTPSTDKLKFGYWTPGPDNDFLQDQPYVRGFIYLQDMIERGIIQSQTDTEVKKPGVYMQLMPYPCYTHDDFVQRFFYILPFLMTLVFSSALAVMTHQLVYEKEQGIEELMKAMGLQSGLNLISWFLINFLLLLIVCLLVVIIVKVGNIFPSSDWSVVFFFLSCFSFSLVMMCYLISTLFHKAHIAALAAIMIYLMTYLPYLILVSLKLTIDKFEHNVLYTLLSTCAFTLGCNILALKESQTIGVQWDSFNQELHDTTYFGFSWACLAMLWDGVLYFIIAWYISSVFPGRHGVPKQWYFIFLPSYWCNCINFGETSEESKTVSHHKNPDIEVDPTSFPLGISIAGLTKKYNNKTTAVDNLTLNFYEGQITSFLGQNGAGKTTTISIIMGLFPATAGKVSIYGKDVMKRLRKIRKDLGVCPQHNALYDQLTVMEHLEMYGRLKGMSLKEIFNQSQDLLIDVGLQDAAYMKVSSLSGGMKRKLSIVIAFLGGSPVVILDEPTSGVDPHARRSIWDLIIKNKKDRTILLCTHFMDEADLLGDRIAILDQGQLRCCGSSTFLKDRFTTGCTLTIAKELPSNQATPEKTRRAAEMDPNTKKAVENIYVDPEDIKDMKEEVEMAEMGSQGSSIGVSSIEESFNTNKVTSLIQNHLPSAVMKEDVRTEVAYTLPVNEGQKAHFKDLFNDLDSHSERLQISSYGISDATLDEVFLKVSSSSDDIDGAKDSARVIAESSMKSSQIVYSMKPSALGQFAAIFTKRFHYTKRDWWSLAWALLVPILWLFLAIAFGTIFIESPQTNLHFSPSLYGPNDYVFFSNGDSYTPEGDKMTSALFGEPGLGTTCMADFQDGSCQSVDPFFKNPISNLTSSERQLIVETDRNAPDCSCSQSFLDCPAGASGSTPPAWTMNTSDILLDISLKPDLNRYLVRTVRDYRWKRFGGLTFHSVKNNDEKVEEIAKAWYNNKGFHAMPTFLNTMNNVILRSFLPANQNPAKYGISAYNHPFRFSEEQRSISGLWEETARYFGISILVLVAFTLIPATFATFLVMENNNRSKRLHYISGVTPACYWIANLTWDMLMYLIPVGISLFIVYIFGMEAFGSVTNMPAFALLLFFFGFSAAIQMYILVPLFRTTGSAFIVFFCLTLVLALITILPKFFQVSPLGLDADHPAFYILNKVFLIFAPFCLASGLVDLLYNQVQADIYGRFGINTFLDPFDMEMLGWKLVALVIQGVVAFIILMFIEYRGRNWCASRISRSVEKHHGAEDEDVISEKKRVQSGNASKDLVCINNLTKVYRSVRNSNLVAVDNMNIGIPSGECFGLLGVNGAGKTTTFRMLINDLTPSDGSLNINSNSIGYCPQLDALYNKLTGNELLYCYAKIKGISGKQRQQAVKFVTAQMGMKKYIEKCIGTYSGGMKRSMSTAIALLGNPQIVLMDEPTTGMDPVSKQAVWGNILAVIKSGHSVILTSHSMEECELLCTRLAIMVNGRFRCLGSPQHVKNRFGDGHTLVLRLNETKPNMTEIMNFVMTTFPEARLKEKHHNMVCYQLPLTARKLGDVFGSLEAEKDNLGIQEYSISQTTLDQVFVNFAKRQTDGSDSCEEKNQDFVNQAYTTDEADIAIDVV
ncbi:uncharacterized protein [Asterias amurensis]|uniref:uncharacterized protein n=1 Tax=Asterias amurensis TaxID=7602 RepID=UPI003AB4658D